MYTTCMGMYITNIRSLSPQLTESPMRAESFCFSFCTFSLSWYFTHVGHNIHLFIHNSSHFLASIVCQFPSRFWDVSLDGDDQKPCPIGIYSSRWNILTIPLISKGENRQGHHNKRTIILTF